MRYIFLTLALILGASSSHAQSESFEPEVLESTKKFDFAPRNTSRLSIAPAGLAYASFDSDGNYEISIQELEAGIDTAFNFADKDKSGVLSLVEVDGWRIKALGSQDLLPGNTQFDRNFDARVTRQEFTQVLDGTATHLDRNDDKILTFDELLTTPPRAVRERENRTPRFPSQTSPRQRR